MTAEGGKFDVIVLGTGIGGSMLSAVLARNQLKVLMIDSETHPRFAIGEATTPDTNFRFKLLGAKYDVPEIGYLSSFHTVRDHVSPACGVKRSFSFLYQREGEAQDPARMHQFPTLAPPMGPDLHFFRQDVDAYMMAAAIRYGAAIRQKTHVSDIDLRDDGVSVRTDKGARFDADYLVDGTGINSVLARKLDLREDPSRFRTDSRAIFTHMAGVRPYEEIGLDRKAHGFEYPLWQSTMHYVFAGGWFWLIPFGNHADSTNPLCSVGLVLNRQVHPETGMDAEEEFWSFVRKFPPMVQQFDGAKAVRPWTTTGRLQYGSKTITGPRYCLLSHAGFFIDPLYSTGLALTTSMVDLLGGTLLEAFAAKDLRVERFEHLNEFFSTNIRHVDEMVGSSFVSFREFDLWDAWFRVWVVANFLGTTLNASLYSRYLETKDRKVLKRSGEEPHTVLLGGKFGEFQKLFRSALAEMDRVRDGSAAPSEAAANIRALFKDINYFPSYYKWHNPSVRTTPAYTLWELLKLHFWYLRHSTRDINEQLLWNPVQTSLYAIRSARDNRRRSLRRNRGYLRDMFRTWNSG